MAKTKLPALGTDNPTGCCPKFDPTPWDGQTFTFDNKLFVRATARSLFHIPLNMGQAISKAWEKVEAAGAKSPDEFVMLSDEKSPWKTDNYLLVSKEVPGLDNVRISGTFVTKVFEGGYADAKNWYTEMQKLGTRDGKLPKNVYFYYTTCPKCAKTYGKNYVVGFAEI